MYYSFMEEQKRGLINIINSEIGKYEHLSDNDKEELINVLQPYVESGYTMPFAQKYGEVLKIIKAYGEKSEIAFKKEQEEIQKKKASETVYDKLDNIDTHLVELIELLKGKI